MKTLTRILSSFFLTLVMAYCAHAQDVFKVAPVGIGTVNPLQALDVTGSVRFLGALMPNGNAGVSGNILLSGGGSPAFPTWLANGTTGQAVTSTGTGVVYAAAGYWNVTGNAGTNPAANFIGTTNDFPLVFLTDGTTITNSTYSGQLDPQFETGPTLKGNTFMGAGSPNEANFALIGGGNNDKGNYNVGFGTGTLGQNTTGIGNVALGGYFTLILNTTGNYNVGLDRGLESNYAGNGSIGIGFDALWEASGTASYNIGIGYEAGFIYTDGASGNGSSLPNAIGNFNTAVGYQALYIGTATNNASSNTAIGNYTLYGSSATGLGKQNTAIGDSALVANTTGNFNTGIGYQANLNAGTYTNATVIGYNTKALASNTITLGNSSDVGGVPPTITTGLYLPGYTSVGAFLYTSANTGIVAPLIPGTNGQYLKSNGPGSAPTWANVTITSGTVTSITGTAPITVTGSWILGIQGNASGTDQGGVLYSAGPSTTALFTPTGTAGTFLTSNGTGVPTWANAYWNLTGNAGTNPAVNFVGTTDDEPLFFHSSGYAGQIDRGSPFKGNTNFGELAGDNDAGTLNVVIGGVGLAVAQTSAILGSNTSGSDNVVVSGYAAAHLNTSGSNNVVFGRALLNSTTGNGNIAMGFQGLRFQSGAESYNIGIGYNAGQGGAAASTTLGWYNTALGYFSLANGAFSASNTALGTNALLGNTGKLNIAVGDSALATNTSGNHNSGLGYQANVGSGALVNATAIGYASSATVSNTVILGGSGANAVNVGIGTSTPARTLELGGTASTIRVDGLATGGTFNTQISATKGNIVYVNNANGDLYALPNGANGTVLTLNANGVPSWGPSVASSITKFSILPGSGSSVAIGGGFANSVVGSGNVTLDIQGTSGGIFYGTGIGTPAAFSAAGTTKQVLLSGGAGAPSWASANSLLTTYNIAKGTGSSVVVGGGFANSVVGSSQVNIDVQGTSGGIFYGAGIGTPAAFTAAGASGNVLQSTGAGAPTWVSSASALNMWFYTGNTVGAAYGAYVIGTLQQGATNLPLEFLANSNATTPIYCTMGLLDNVNNNVYFGGNVNGGWPGGNGTATLDGASRNVGIGMGALDVANSSGVAVQTSGADAGVINDVFFGYGTGISLYVANSTAIGTASQRNVDGPGFTIGGPNTSLGNFDFRTSNGGQGFTLTGNHNTAIGNESQYDGTTETCNTSIGDLSMDGSSNGAISYSYNTATGSYALFSITTGLDNTAVGTHAVYSTTVSPNNTAIGYYALYSNSTGVNGANTAIGYETSYNNTTAHNSTAIGYEAGFTNTTLYGNTSIGANALEGTNSEAGQTIIGTNAMHSGSSATADPAVAIGDSAMYANTGQNIVVIGAGASVAAAGTNSQIVAVGYGANQKNASSSTDFQGLVFGYKALGIASTGAAYGTHAIGAGAMGGGLVTGSGGNLALGASALYNLTSGVSNVAIGSANSVTNANLNAPLGEVTTGGSNTAIGVNAASLTNGSSNVSIGANSSVGGVLSPLTVGTGGSNTAVGTSATAGGISTATVASNDNTALGFSASAGASNTTTLTDFSTAIGALSVAAPTTGTATTTTATALGVSASATANNSTAIGANAVANTANTVILGGTGANSVFVGVGTSNPQQELEVGGLTNTINLPGISSANTPFGKTAPSAPTDEILFAKTSGDVYAIPNSPTVGSLMILNPSGIPTWGAPPSNVTASLPLSNTGTPTNPNILLSGTLGGVFYGTGAGTGSSYTNYGPVSALHPADSVYVLESQGAGLAPVWVEVGINAASADAWGSQTIVTDSANTGGIENTLNGQGTSSHPLVLAQQGAVTTPYNSVLTWNGYTWKPSSANVSLIKNNITTPGSAIAITNGTNQVVGGSDVTLDIQGTSDGLLSGNGAGNSATFTAGGANGLAITSNGASTPSWQAITVPILWGLNGNGGTAAGTDFVGTTDDKQLWFYTDNAYAGSIDPQTVGVTTLGNTYFGGARTQNSDNGAGNGDAGTYNVALGNGSLGQITTSAGLSSGNISMGGLSLPCITTGSYNIGIGGFLALRYAYQGNGDIGLGYQSLYGLSGTSSYNIGIGYNAGFEGTNCGASNGCSNNYLGNFNALLGDYTLYNAAGNQIASNTGVGTYALYNTTASRNTAAGDSALYANTTGTNNSALGYQSHVAAAGLTNATVIGYQASAPASNSITLGNTAATALYIPGYNTVGSLYYTSASGLVSSLTPSTSGYMLESNGPGFAPIWANVPVGGGTVTNVFGSGPIVVSGTWTIGIQGSALDKGGVLYSAGPATTALFSPTPTSGLYLTSTGTGVPTWGTLTTNAWNTTGNAGTTFSNFVGTTDAHRLQFDVNNNGTVANSGSIDLGVATNGSTGYANTYLGSGSTNSGTEAGNQDAGTYNVGIGRGTMATMSTGLGNVAIGTLAMNAGGTTGNYNVSIGYGTGYDISSGAGNAFMGGSQVGHPFTSGSYNIAIGSLAMSDNNNTSGGTASYNAAVGYSSLLTDLTGASNTAIGVHAAYLTTTSTNTAIGDSALYTNSTGKNNTALGYAANVSSAALTNTTSVGAQAYASTSNTIVLGDISGINGAPANNINVGIGTQAPNTDAGLAIKTGHLESQGQLSAGNVTPGSAAGSGASAVINSDATDISGSITLTTGSSSYATGPQATIAFTTPYSYSPIISLSPANAAAAAAMTANQVYVTSNTGSFSINFGSAASTSTAYNFNYVAIETPGTQPTIAQACHVPVTLNNVPDIINPTPVNFQQMVTVNSANYSSEEFSGLQNVEFTSGSPLPTGTPLYAWLESGASSSSNNSIWWVNLGSSQVPAGSTLVIYMNFLTTSAMSSTSSFTGEAPQLSGTYGQYDNGSHVFSNYWDFNGSLPSGLSFVNTGGSGSLSYGSNGVTLTLSTPNWSSYIVSSSTYTPGSSGIVVEADMAQNSIPVNAEAAMAALVATPNMASSTAAYSGIVQEPSSSNAGGFAYVSDYENGGGAFPGNLIGSYVTDNTNLNVWSLGITSTGTLGFGYVNYGTTLSSGASATNTLSNFFIGFQTTQLSATMPWLRTRIYPPANFMPTQSFGTETCP